MRMKHEPVRKRRATNVSLPEVLVEEARQFDVNISKECTAGLKAAVKREKVRRWQEQHRERIDAFAEWLDHNGMPFEDLRVF